MKRIILFFVVAVFAVTVSNAQIRKVPSEVTNAFKAKYPNAQDVEWKDKITSFHAVFTDNGTKKEASFTKDGWKETESEMEFNGLPEEVKDGFAKSKYADWEHGSVVEIQKSDDALQYRIYVEKSTLNKKFLFFNKNGKLLKDALTL